ncbi:hypothetical protein FRB95_010393 [Tulasnella sp. JGI-2019a]|nr:hypothetical protein FRB95_010393 [Tulasnella sp. JGI-2019a]
MRFSQFITSLITLGFIAAVGAVPVNERRDCVIGSSCLQSRKDGGEDGNGGGDFIGLAAGGYVAVVVGSD